MAFRPALGRNVGCGDPVNLVITFRSISADLGAPADACAMWVHLFLGTEQIVVGQDPSKLNSGWNFLLHRCTVPSVELVALLWSVRLSRQSCELEERHARTRKLGVTIPKNLSNQWFTMIVWPSKVQICRSNGCCNLHVDGATCS